MPKVKLMSWDRRSKNPAGPVEIDTSKAKHVRDRFWEQVDGSQKEGAVIVMKDGQEIHVVESGLEARKLTGLPNENPGKPQRSESAEPNPA